MVRDVQVRTRLTGSASWLAIVGATFFWTWLDQCMFGPSLFSPSEQVLEDLSVLTIGFSSIMGMGIACAFQSWGEKPKLWHPLFVSAAACLGAVGCALCGLSLDQSGVQAIYVLSTVLVGVSMGCFQISWGKVAVAQGVDKALLHLAGAWGLGILVNLMLPLLFWKSGWFAAAILPLLSAISYGVLYKLQGKGAYHVAEASNGQTADDILPGIHSDSPEGAESVFAERHMRVAKDFVIIVFVVCVLFGMMVMLHHPSEGAATLAENGMDAVIARCATSVVVFVFCVLLTRQRIPLVFNTALSFVALGAIALTMSVFDIAWQNPGRLLVAVGYTGFDLLTWGIIARYCEFPNSDSAKVILLVIGAQQAGIVIGELLSLLTVAANIGTQAASVLLVALNYGLLVACYILLKRYVGLVGDAGAGASANAGAGDVGSFSLEPGRTSQQEIETRARAESVVAFAKEKGLTSRETDVLLLLAEGRSVPFIAEKFVVSENTVKTHVRHIYAKCDFHDRQELLSALESIRQQR